MEYENTGTEKSPEYGAWDLERGKTCEGKRRDGRKTVEVC